MRSIFGSGLYGCVYQMRQRKRERERNEERERVQFENIFSHSNVVKLGSVPDGI